MLGILAIIGIVIICTVPLFMVVASCVIIYGWVKAARARKREAAIASNAKRVGLV